MVLSRKLTVNGILERHVRNTLQTLNNASLGLLRVPHHQRIAFQFRRHRIERLGDIRPLQLGIKNC